MARTEPIRIGIAGIGRAGWGMHCSELEGRENRFHIVAACDVDRERRTRMAERYGCKTYRHIEDLAADPDVELVDIATRSPDHVPHALSALKAGKHVFLEKPISLTHSGAQRLQKAAEKAKGDLFIRHNRRFEPAFQHIRELIASGVLGFVYEIRLCRQSFQRRDDWQTLLHCGGGQLLNWGPHVVDHALRLLEASVVKQWSELRKVAAVGDAEDHLRILLAGANGRTVEVEISGGAALKSPEYFVLGTRGGLTCTGNDIHLRYLDPKHKLQRRRAKASTPPAGGSFGSADNLKWVDRTIPVSPKMPCAMDSIWDHLFDAIRKGKPFPITLDEAVQVMDVISKARKGTPFTGGARNG